MRLIDKDILVSWIGNRMLPTVRTIKYDDWECGENNERINILNFIKELEVKEVDLEKKEIIDKACWWLNNNRLGVIDDDYIKEFRKAINN